MINYGEKLFNPDIGSNLMKSLFEPLDGFSLNDMQDHIVNTITFHEPRANLIDVRVGASGINDNSVTATIVFILINTGETATLNLILRRVR
jgi:phage baseplate assembly protein W